ncbi:hypothetical protein ACTFIV_006548 [Dictyostelium citrinum]
MENIENTTTTLTKEETTANTNNNNNNNNTDTNNDNNSIAIEESNKTKPKGSNINNNLKTTVGVLDNVKEDQSWLSSLKLHTFDHMIDISRTLCKKCEKKRKYFCYDCCLPLGDPENSPKLKLPLKVDVIHHPTELISKSTAIHSKVIAYDDVKFIEFPEEIPDYNLDETILLYPSEDSCFVKDIDFSNIKKVLFVESQWHNARKILKHPKLQGIKCVKIDMQKTMFWRHQRHGDSYLATIEAIYYFFKEFHLSQNNNQYNGEYDNLLFYYSFFYNLIQTTYKQQNRDFIRKDNYIQ